MQVSLRRAGVWLRDHISVPHVHLPQLRRLPKIMRIFHPASRKHLLAYGIGVGMMFSGSHIAHLSIIPHAIADVLGYAVHGLGLVPIAAHADAWFKILTA